MEMKKSTMTLKSIARIIIKLDNVLILNFSVLTRSYVFPVAGGVMVSQTVAMAVMSVLSSMRKLRYRLIMTSSPTQNLQWME